MRKSGHRSANRGLTLVELIVVIVIIAVLSALGLQGYRMARLRANQVVSTANLRQLAAANLLYVADHSTYCPAGERTNRIRWHGGRISTKDKYDPTQGYLSEYLGDSRQVGKCPQLEHMINASAFNEDGSGGYGYNSAYLGGWQDGVPNLPSRPANIASPERTLMFATTAFAVPGGLQEYPFADPPRAVDANGRLKQKLQPSIHFRFNGRALIAWCDGHVSEVSKRISSQTNSYGGDNDEANIGFCGPAELNGWWNPRN